METSAMPTKDELTVIGELARTLLPTGMFPRALDSAGKIAAVLLRGRELGIPPMQALAAIHVVEGRTVIAADLMAALVTRAGGVIEIVTSTPEMCEAVCRRGAATYRVAWTMADAGRAGLAGRPTWQRYPAQMLRARVRAEIARLAYPDILLGCYEPDEAQDIAGRLAENGPPTRVLICQPRETLIEELAMPTADQLGERPAEDDQNPPAPITPVDPAAQRARFRELRALLGPAEVLAVYRRAGIGDGSKPTDAQRASILAEMEEIVSVGAKGGVA